MQNDQFTRTVAVSLSEGTVRRGTAYSHVDIVLVRVYMYLSVTITTRYKTTTEWINGKQTRTPIPIETHTQNS